MFFAEEERAQGRAERFPTGRPPCQEMASLSQVGLTAHISASGNACFATEDAPSSTKVLSGRAAKLWDYRLLCPPQGALCHGAELGSSRRARSGLGGLLSTTPLAQRWGHLSFADGRCCCRCGQAWSQEGPRAAISTRVLWPCCTGSNALSP